MSLIIHRCTVCAHPDIWHEPDNTCSWGHCWKARHILTPGPSETLTTYTLNGATVTDIATPGTRFAGFGRGTVALCGCAHCRALHAALTGARTGVRQ